MRRTNDRYLILLTTRKHQERYIRDSEGWLKISTRGRKFRATAEQVLNHLLPALAGLARGVTVTVEYRGTPVTEWTFRQTQPNSRGLARTRRPISVLP